MLVLKVVSKLSRLPSSISLLFTPLLFRMAVGHH